MAEEMDHNTVSRRVIKVIAEVFNTDAEKLTMETKIVDDLGAESLDIITLLLEFEGEFDRRIPDEDAEKLITIGDAVHYVMHILKVPAQG
jgi:acyl carrier protein